MDRDPGKPPPYQPPVWRFVQPRLGMAWVKTGGRLRPGVIVEVTELYRENLACWVETSWGVSMRMLTQSIDFGLEFRTRKGEWIPEADPRARRWLLRVRGELLAGAAPRHVGDYGHRLNLEEAERILGRNGVVLKSRDKGRQGESFCARARKWGT
jgi:hypothetical protein